MDDEQNRWEARREREKARVRVKLEHVVGLIARLGQERDAVQRQNTSKRLVDAFMDLTIEGPGPDPEEARLARASEPAAGGGAAAG